MKSLSLKLGSVSRGERERQLYRANGTIRDHRENTRSADGVEFRRVVNLSWRGDEIRDSGCYVVEELGEKDSRAGNDEYFLLFL